MDATLSSLCLPLAISSASRWSQKICVRSPAFCSRKCPLRDVGFCAQSHHRYRGRSKKSERMSDGSLFQTYFDCNCLGTASGPDGASQGTLKHLIVQPTDEPIQCGGSVKVTAEIDTSHPAGIVGQKISVQVYH